MPGGQSATAAAFRLPLAWPARYHPFMEILSLKAALTEDDVNGLLARHLDGEVPVRDLRVRLTPEGVHVMGTYPVAFFKVKFDTLWALSVREGELAAHLAGLQVAGAPAGVVRGTLMEMLAANIEREPGFRVDGETILVDVDGLLSRVGLSSHTNLRAVCCEAGRIIVEGGAATPV